MKYNKGDVVRIKDRKWYDENKDKSGRIQCGENSFVKEMIFLLDSSLEIDDFSIGGYIIKGYYYLITEDMIAYKESEMDENNEIKFEDISNELYRVYDFGNGNIVKLYRPIKLNVSESGGHRVLTEDGLSHYIPFKWIHIYWKSKDGCSKFIK